MPTFNSCKTIKQALDSVLSQKFTDLEILIIDAASTDETIHIIREYSKNDSRVSSISEKDSGLYDAMNKGIDLAKGEWLFFLGSDDRLFRDDVLQDVCDSLEKQNVVYGDVIIDGDTSWAKDGDRYDGEFDVKKLLRENICHQSIFYRSEFVRKEIGYFNLDYKLCSDWDFNLRCKAKTDFLYLNKIIAFFNGGGESTNNFHDHNFSRDFLANVMSYFRFDLFYPIFLDCKQIFKRIGDFNNSRIIRKNCKRKLFIGKASQWNCE